VKVWPHSSAETRRTRTRKKFPLFKLEFKWLESKGAAVALGLAPVGREKSPTKRPSRRR
jgi:hypothetical protein